jgi:dTDP-4-dehydrorhamnose reductase
MEKKTMLITGGKGMLGHEIFARLAGEYEIRVTDLGELDVTSPGECRRAIGGFRPDVVVHCAAYTAVDRAESEEALAFKLNADGTRNVARECREQGAILVTFGTDYVFDGTSSVPYREEDPPHPLSAYGRSKLAAEEALKAEAPSHLLIRTQWLYGAHGRNFVFAILDRARRGEPLRVVSDQRGTPTSARDLAVATGRLLESGARGTFHFSNEGETTWFDFASFLLAQAVPGPFPVSRALTGDLAYPAPRPAYSVLSKEKYREVTGDVPRRWEEAVTEFLKILHEGEDARRCES